MEGLVVVVEAPEDALDELGVVGEAGVLGGVGGVKEALAVAIETIGHVGQGGVAQLTPEGGATLQQEAGDLGRGAEGAQDAPAEDGHEAITGGSGVMAKRGKHDTLEAGRRGRQGVHVGVGVAAGAELDLAGSAVLPGGARR